MLRSLRRRLPLGLYFVADQLDCVLDELGMARDDDLDGWGLECVLGLRRVVMAIYRGLGVGRGP